jgi:hypothetical protein
MIPSYAEQDSSDGSVSRTRPESEHDNESDSSSQGGGLDFMRAPLGGDEMVDYELPEDYTPTPTQPIRATSWQALGLLGNALRARRQFDAATGQDEAVAVPVTECVCAMPGWIGSAATLAGEFVKECTKVTSNIYNVANPGGAQELYVIDVTLPTVVFSACLQASDSLAGEDKPARNLILAKCQRKLKRILSGKVTQSTYNYVESITHLTIMALLLDAGNTGKDHCHILDYSGTQTTFTDFFATSRLEEAIEDVKAAKQDAGMDKGDLVLAGPAPTIQPEGGELSKAIVLLETPLLGEYELKDQEHPVGAIKMGVDLIGKAPPNSHLNPLNIVGALYRHEGNYKDVVSEGTDFEYCVTLDRSEKAKMSAVHERVFNDIIEAHAKAYRTILTDENQKFDFDFLEDGGPNSYTDEKYKEYLAEALSNENFWATESAVSDLLLNITATKAHMEHLQATGNLKKGEDSKRARITIAPGRMGSEGLHQSRNSPLIKSLEALQAVFYNHSNLKGCTEETKRIKFAEFLMAIPQGAACFGTDKNHNDGSFREDVWKMVVKYLAVMVEIFEEADRLFTRPYVLSPNEAETAESFPNGNIDLKYWVLKLTPLLAILLSGISATSFINRIESTVEQGVGVLVVNGEEAYKKWLSAQSGAKVSTHPAWGRHALPHVADIVEWQPLAPQMATTTSVSVDKLTEEQIIAHVMSLLEGDDQTRGVIFPKGTDVDAASWEALSIRDKIHRYVSLLSKYTGFVFEAALPVDDFDMVGRNSLFEMLSAWVCLPPMIEGKPAAYEVAVIVPKVLKALKKIPHATISSRHTLERDESTGEVTGVTKNAEFYALGLTRYYALAIINHESLGVRGLLLKHADRCYDKLVLLVGESVAYTYTTMYGDRDPERRGVVEADFTKFDYCGVMRETAHDLINSVDKRRVIRCCTGAWRAELPALASIDKKKVSAGLLELDNLTLMLEVTDDMVEDPMLLWMELEPAAVVLEPLLQVAMHSHKEVAAIFRSHNMNADAEETVRLAREHTRNNTSGSAEKGGGSKGKGTGKHKGHENAGKGKGTPDGGTKGRPKGRSTKSDDSWRRPWWDTTHGKAKGSR